MSNPIVTPAMFKIMQNGLGLGVFQRKPSRNQVIPAYHGRDDALIDQMIDMELLETRILVNQGKERYIMVTPEGIRLTVDDFNKDEE